MATNNLLFWGVEVKAKEPFLVSVEPGCYIHVSQATLGGIKKDDDTVTVHVKTGEKKLVLAILSKKNPQMTFDLVFEEDFEISHNWKNGNIHLMGYQNDDVETESDESSDEDEDDDVPIALENAVVSVPAVNPKAADKSKAEVHGDSTSSDDDDFDEDVTDEDDSEEDETSVSEEEDGEDGEDGSDDSEEETPVKVAEVSKKRPNADAKTPPQSKKAKATPQKTDGKKAGQPATPLPSKKVAKTPGNDKTPKSGGSEVSCGSCKKSFKSAPALESHNKAKHGAK